jgi:MFS family permease
MQKAASPQSAMSPEVSTPTFMVGAALLAIASLTVIANAAVAPSMPGLRDAFKDTPAVNTLIGLVITLPSLGIVLTAGLGGWLCDRFGRRPVMLSALLIYGLAGISAYFAQSLWQVLIGRFVLGLGIGGTMTSAMAMIGDRYHGEARVRLMSLQTAVMSSSSMVLLLIGGVLGEYGWRYPFLVYASALILIPFALILLPEPKREPLTAAESEASFSLRPFLLIGLTALFSMVMYYMLPTRLPFLLRDLGVNSPSVAGLAVATGTFTMVAMALLYGRLGAHLKPMTIYAVIFGFTAVGFTIIGLAPSLPVVFLGSAISGLGYGWLFPVNNILIMERSTAATRGRAAGFHTTTIFFGQFLSPLLSGPIVDRSSVAISFLVFAAAAAVLTGMFLLAGRKAN